MHLSRLHLLRNVDAEDEEGSKAVGGPSWMRDFCACRLSRALAEEAKQAWLWGTLRNLEPGDPAWACLGLLWAESCLWRAGVGRT